MAETTATTTAPAEKIGHRTEKIGLVTSTKMDKTIVVSVEMRKAHPKYKRVVKSNKKFYAHDEQNSARVGDQVRIRESRPLSKLKRWNLEEIVRRSSLSHERSGSRSPKLTSAGTTRLARRTAVDVACRSSPRPRPMRLHWGTAPGPGGKPVGQERTQCPYKCAPSWTLPITRARAVCR